MKNPLNIKATKRTFWITTATLLFLDTVVVGHMMDETVEPTSPEPTLVLKQCEPVLYSIDTNVVSVPVTTKPISVINLDIAPKVQKKKIIVPPVDVNAFRKGIMHWEGFRSKIYYCVGSAKTIGYGFTGSEIKDRKSISKKVAQDQLIKEVIPKYGKLVDRYVKVPITETQRLALISFTYNLGQGNLRKLVNGKGRLNDGNYDSVPDLLKQYVIAGGKKRDGLVLRRSWEVDVWNGDIHSNYGN